MPKIEQKVWLCEGTIQYQVAVYLCGDQMLQYQIISGGL
jgi:hypothetical protein